MANIVEVIIKGRDKMTGELQKAGKGLDKFKANLGKIAIAAGAMSAVYTAAMGKMVKDTAQFGDLMAKTSTRTGIAADTLSQLHFVAERTGTQFQRLTMGFKQLSQTAYDAQRGMVTYLDVYNDLGVTVTTTDGQLKDMKTLLFDVADAISKETNATKASAIATKLLGRAGQELIPILMEGRSGFKDLLDESEALGMSMSVEQAKAWERFVDRMTDAQAAMRGLKMRIAASLAPAIEALVKWVTKIIASISKWVDKHPGWTRAIGYLTIAIAGGAGLLAALAGLAMMAPAIGAAWAIMMGPVGWIALAIAGLGAVIWKFHDDIAAAFSKVGGWCKQVGGWFDEHVIRPIDDAVLSWSELNQEIDEFLGKPIGGGGGAGTGGGGAGFEALPAPPPGVGDALVDVNAILANTSLVTKGATDEVGKLADEFARVVNLKTKIKGLTEPIRKIETGWKATGEAIRQVAEGVSTKFGNALAQCVVYGQDFGQSMKDIFKSWAAVAIAEIGKVLAKMAVLEAAEYITGQEMGSGGGKDYEVWGEFSGVGLIQKIFGFKHGGIVPAYQHGGITPSGGGGMPAVLHPREMVLTPDDQQKLLGAIRSGSLGGTVQHIEINTLDAKSFLHWIKYGDGRNAMRRAGAF